MVRKTGVLLLGITFFTSCVFLAGCACKSKQTSAGLLDTGQAQVQPGTQDVVDLSGLEDQLARELIFAEASKEVQTIYFDYDSALLKSEATTRLQKAAAYLKQNSNVRILVEGHCDERGTNEYNLALGERRAASARRYLMSLGVSPDQIFTISYGEERAAVQGHDESAWQYNRRDEFKASL